MKVNIQKYNSTQGRAGEVLIQYGDIGITEDDEFLLRTYLGIISLNRPSRAWNGTCGISVTKLAPGTQILLTVE